ncbi:sodium:proton antiporter [Fusibacter bizertensis]|uniref:Sodium:proton antiporter n=1 Tax=Fusibacter bizertensis TaxID=1488331 RepID=A0ABT6NE00_9FIRM|nr:sodium:proton antiporter [Fusibacter bizertensis]MDH8678627.1 sodium:proton antiporter [Fusibacter bizertensis]
MENAIIQSADQLMELMGLVILAGLIFTKISNIVKLPDVVLYILAGIILGPRLLNWINIDKYPVENQLILSFGAAYILYDGGREIDLKILNKVKLSVGMLSTVGVMISTTIVGFVAMKVFNLPLTYALLLGSVIASTDPSVLVPLFKKMNISTKLKQSIISESAFNDAAGAVITFSLLAVILGGEFSLGESLLELVTSIIGGLAIGATIGYMTHLLTDEKQKWGIFKDYATELVLVSVVGSYLISNHFGFSGFMAVFIMGMFCGNKKIFKFWIPEESFQSHLRFKEVLTVILRMMIFILLGTHLQFDTLIANLGSTLIVVGALIFVARPISVLACVLIDKKAEWTWKQIIYLMWVRETGVIPAALAGMLVTSGVLHSDIISSVTFATIMVTLTFQASTAGILAHFLKLDVGK